MQKIPRGEKEETEKTKGENDKRHVEEKGKESTWMTCKHGQELGTVIETS